MDTTQQLQDDQYEFPYHYLVESEGRFSQTKTLRWGFIYRSYIEYIKTLLSDTSFDSVAEVGSGDGKIIHALQKAFPEATYTGIDYSERACALARAFNPNAEILCDDIRNVNRTFDMVLCIETLEHIPPEEVDAFVHNLYRITGQYLILTVPSTNIPVKKKHYQHFEADQLTRVLQPFEAVTVQYLNRQNILKHALKTCMSNKLFTINTPKITHPLFQLYMRKNLYADSSDGSRIAVLMKK
jgi:SAM-dependent methyltransferase